MADSQECRVEVPIPAARRRSAYELLVTSTACQLVIRHSKTKVNSTCFVFMILKLYSYSEPDSNTYQRVSQNHPNHRLPGQEPTGALIYILVQARFLIDESEQLVRRRVRLNVDELGRIAANSVDAEHCVDLLQHVPRRLYNEAYILAMGNGMQAIGMAPNPNAGVPQLVILQLVK
ncbi:hypothetical protein PAAG_05366 [Paracoccidioides lutzii Pb01]|uniref:Uncharacterized protein n=1 Tax=Paracoccidioides lutzii (strain ATCC MYA-826 / Pb01) TaxID=502779 RepID=C1H3M3_PARBA|nr:hypothetical protein PAAG_05366 [Paracoccidioides lutzii Pb01]EEH34317.2 hypothetical protein PAAG_05366 [Paracoccidioides lutzii Pb01]